MGMGALGGMAAQTGGRYDVRGRVPRSSLLGRGFSIHLTRSSGHMVITVPRHARAKLNRGTPRLLSCTRYPLKPLVSTQIANIGFSSPIRWFHLADNDFRVLSFAEEQRRTNSPGRSPRVRDLLRTRPPRWGGEGPVAACTVTLLT